MGRCVTVVCFSFLSVPSRINFFHRLALPGHNDSCGRLCGDSFCFLLWHVCIKFGLNTKTVLMVYTNFPAHFIKSTTSMNLICILDWRGLYSVFQELLKGKKNPKKTTQQLLDSLISYKECPVKKIKFQTDRGLVLRWTQILP